MGENIYPKSAGIGSSSLDNHEQDRAGEDEWTMFIFIYYRWLAPMRIHTAIYRISFKYNYRQQTVFTPRELLALRYFRDGPHT